MFTGESPVKLQICLRHGPSFHSQDASSRSARMAQKSLFGTMHWNTRVLSHPNKKLVSWVCVSGSTWCFTAYVWAWEHEKACLCARRLCPCMHVSAGKDRNSANIDVCVNIAHTGKRTYLMTSFWTRRAVKSATCTLAREDSCSSASLSKMSARTKSHLSCVVSVSVCVLWFVCLFFVWFMCCVSAVYTSQYVGHVHNKWKKSSLLCEHVRAGAWRIPLLHIYTYIYIYTLFMYVHIYLVRCDVPLCTYMYIHASVCVCVDREREREGDEKEIEGGRGGGERC